MHNLLIRDTVDRSKLATISAFVLTLVEFDVPQSIFRYDSVTISATAVESGLFVPLSGCCKALKHALARPDRQHYYEHPNSSGQLESVDKLP
jgi:hypothetical protein